MEQAWTFARRGGILTAENSEKQRIFRPGNADGNTPGPT
jgi:hypothetical protein